MVSLREKRQDAVDRCNYVWMPALLGFFAVLIVGKLHFGFGMPPIKCLVSDANATKGLELFVNGYCVLGNTYRAGLDESLPLPAETRAERRVFFHDWMPWIFAAQICLLMVPKLMWTLFNESGNWRSPTVMVRIEMALAKWTAKKKGSSTSCKSRWAGPASNAYLAARSGAKSKGIRQRIVPAPPPIARVDSTQPPNRSGLPPNGSSPRLPPGNMTGATATGAQSCGFTYAYVAYKALQLANSLFQLIALNAFLGPEYKLWGYGVLKDLIAGNPWQQSAKFPFVTYCDVELLCSTSPIVLEDRTFQCVLLINMHIQQFLIYVWWWLAVLTVMNFASLVKWTYYACSERSSRDFIRSQLSGHLLLYKLNRDCLRRFVDEHLGLDGVTTLRLIEANSDGLVTANIVHELWVGFSANAEQYGGANIAHVLWVGFNANAEQPDEANNRQPQQVGMANGKRGNHNGQNGAPLPV